MRTRSRFELSAAQREQLKRAVALEWVTIAFFATVIPVMYFVMGGSQAMKAAWVEDVLSLVPPISLLIALRFRDRPPNDRFPYGYRRATLLSFLVASVAVLVFGLYMLYDSAATLLRQEHPTLGHFDLFGWHVWTGWVMIAVLVYSMVPAVILGRMKLPLARELYEKTLHADATMNKADWMTAGAAIVGILGVGLGFWWADAVAAAFISFDITRDGVRSVRGAMSDLMDQQPTQVDSDRPLGLEQRLQDALERLPDVAGAVVRLREEGHVFSGEAFVVLAVQADVPGQLRRISEQLCSLDWRLHEVVVMPVASLEEL